MTSICDGIASDPVREKCGGKTVAAITQVYEQRPDRVKELFRDAIANINLCGGPHVEVTKQKIRDSLPSPLSGIWQESLHNEVWT